jgi:DNA-binding NarL/FixJ family response regulator
VRQSDDSSPVPVLVVDDHDFFLGVLRDVIEATPGMTLVGDANSGEAAVEAVETLSPRMVVMDKRMRGIGGIEAARRINARHPEIVVVLVSVEAPEDGALAASGAAAFLHKRTLSPHVLSEVWQAHGG